VSSAAPDAASPSNTAVIDVEIVVVALRSAALRNQFVNEGFLSAIDILSFRAERRTSRDLVDHAWYDSVTQASWVRSLTSFGMTSVLIIYRVTPQPATFLLLTPPPMHRFSRG
jgi:hypothetical protein